MSSVDHFTGCLLGLALGDALGAPYESGPLERLVWRVIGRTRRGERRWTDDTQMSLDLADSLIALERFDADDVADRFARSYRWSRGYGPGAARILRRIRRGMHWSEANRSVYPDGSYGNGAAMRAPVVGLFHADDPEAILTVARESARITHAHPRGVEAVLIATTIGTIVVEDVGGIELLDVVASRCDQPVFRERLQLAHDWLVAGSDIPPGAVGKQLGRGIAAEESCVTAVYLGLRFAGRPFHSLTEFTQRMGGDVDTIAAMGGAIWGARNGISALPSDALAELEKRDRIMDTATNLWRVATKAPLE